MIPAPEHDRALGMDFYITDENGCGGVLRSSPEDFKVIELYEELGYEGGKYLILELEKKDWDTHHLIRELSRQLGISQKRFNWAGTKDKRAVTSQRISITYLNEIELKRIKLPDIRIRVLGRTNRAVGLGDLLGNRFYIKIREINCNGVDVEKNVSKITDEIYRFGGVPNYFGVQRFGEIRPITHKVGESLVRGMIEEAVFVYLAQPFQGELEQTQEARRELWETRDVGEAIKIYPKYLRYELAILNYIIEHPGDYAKSFNVLSPNLRRLFVHAYQSYIFNQILSRRLAAGMPLNQAIEGDVVCFSKGGLANITKLQQVTSTNLDAVNKLINHHRAYVTLPLVGYESCLALGTQGEIERDILEEQAISPADFKIPANVDLSSKGSRRVALLRISPNIHVIGNIAEFDFSLPPGSYATVVLREYMKSGMLIT
ncbi:MAG: tRNA pseudouridine(13) synthase TruD [Methanotrichaceae archaeon]|nr:tRNA pseudouridine(13) synthase TruD [Methanotrichaceae archaeon]